MRCRFGGSKSNRQLREYFAPLGVSYFFIPPDKTRYFRYLAHMDSPSKAQYDPREIETFGGMDRSPLISVSEEEQYNALRELCAYVDETGNTEFYHLAHYAFDSDKPDYLDVLCKKSGFWQLYLPSAERCRRRQRDYQGDLR